MLSTFEDYACLTRNSGWTVETRFDCCEAKWCSGGFNSAASVTIAHGVMISCDDRSVSELRQASVVRHSSVFVFAGFLVSFASWRTRGSICLYQAWSLWLECDSESWNVLRRGRNRTPRSKLLFSNEATETLLAERDLRAHTQTLTTAHIRTKESALDVRIRQSQTIRTRSLLCV